ncbi:response regulator transcription factor [Microbacterium sp. dk485]|uniref:LuxR C-terminal-related transcriptional regulator n=1 Tax=Microbacterium sp. dk485 TaxID=2560021 RepID=UPI0010740D1B|nr:response regulator transcription factor [Microbacterium sp. dk485]TFV83673.1 response regulator transcription factor [Microbacterium sp. dk485]
MFGESVTAPAVVRQRTVGQESVLIRIFLIHSHEIFRRGLRDLIGAARDLVVVGESGSVHESARRIAVSLPDVVIVDAVLPDGNGIELARSIRAKNRRARCLILGRPGREEVRGDAAAAGAHGYLPDDVQARILLDVIRRVARGEQVAARIAVSPRPEPEATRAPGGDPDRDPHLTTRERQVLRLIASGMSNRQIGEQLGLAEKTVKNYVSALLAKLHVQRRTQAAIYEMTHKPGLDADPLPTVNQAVAR